MESLMKGAIQAFLEENKGSRNGYYERDLGTRYGKINDLRVPRDRNNEFQTALFERYQRNIGIDDLVVSMYSRGISTRKMAEILEELFHNRYSRSTISRITDGRGRATAVHSRRSSGNRGGSKTAVSEG